MYSLGINALVGRDKWSGVDWYIHHLLRQMKQNSLPEWEVFLYSPFPETESNYELARITNPNWRWKQLPWLPGRGWNQIRLSWEMMKRPPNVLFAPGSSIPFIHPHSWNKKKAAVATIHDVAFLKHPELYDPTDRRRQTLALSSAIHHAAVLFVPSEATKNELASVVHDPSRIVVTPLGVSGYWPDTNSARVAETLARHRISQPYLLYVGRIDEKKNLKTLVRAFAAWSRTPPQAEGGEMPLRLVLAGSDGFRALELKELVQSLGVNDLVQFPGYVPEEDLNALYNGALAFVFPSAAEGFGLPVLQALAAGVPTLVSDIPTHREVAGPAALYAETGNIEWWVDQLQRIVFNESLRVNMIKNGIERAKQYSWERTAGLTWEAIRKLVQ